MRIWRVSGLNISALKGTACGPPSDDDLVAQATREIEILGLCDPQQIMRGAVVRQEKAYPVYDDDYEANVQAMRDELEEPPPVCTWSGATGCAVTTIRIMR